MGRSCNSKKSYTDLVCLLHLQPKERRLLNRVELLLLEKKGGKKLPIAQKCIIVQTWTSILKMRRFLILDHLKHPLKTRNMSLFNKVRFKIKKIVIVVVNSLCAVI